MSKSAWADVIAWANTEIEAARTALETAAPADVAALQARCAVMRDLQKHTQTPTAAELPPSVPY